MSDDFQGRGGSPWGTPPGGGNGSGKGPTPPDIDDNHKEIQKRINIQIFMGEVRWKTNWVNFNYFSIGLGSKWVV